MGKVKSKIINKFTLVEGDVNLLRSNEVLISEEEGYTILRKKLSTGEIETYVIIPLKDFKKE